MDNKSKVKVKPVSYRLPNQIKTLISILSQRMLVSKTAVVTLAILHFAEFKGVEVEDNETF